MTKAGIKGKVLSVALAVLTVGLMFGGVVSVAGPTNVQLALSDSTQVYLYPQDSIAPFCDTVDVEIWVNAAEFQAGQIKLVYDSACVDITNWVRNPADFPLGTWESDTPGEEWITFTATSSMTGGYPIGTMTIHGVSEIADCSTTLDFVDPSELFDQSGNEIAANWIDGTLQCRVEAFWSVPMVADAGLEGSNADLEFGIHPDANDGYDSDMDLPSPPPGPGAPFEAYFSIVDPLFPRVNKDLRGEMPNEWTLEARSIDENIELSWDTADAPQGVALGLVSRETEIDMKAVDSMTLSAGTHAITIIAEEIEIDQYNLAISSTSGGSVITPGEGTFPYNQGATVNLVAETEEGYRFARWTGNVGTVADVNAAVTTVTMQGDYSITADFATPPIQYNLTVSSTNGGSVIEPGEGTFPYDEGTTVNLVGEAEDGYRLINWTGDVDTIGDVDAVSTTISMERDCTITANFEEISPLPPMLTLTINSTAGGSVAIPGEGNFQYGNGTVVNLTAQAEEGYRFASWTGDVDTIANVNAASTTISVEGDYAIMAGFDEIASVNWALVGGIIAVVVVGVALTLFVRKRGPGP